jgi:hypothetical protein
MKMLLTVLLLAGTAGAAFAQTATNTMAPAASPKGLDEAHARYAAYAAGYTNVSNLTSDKKGNWMGAGNKGNFMIDSSGKVTPRD